MSESGEEVVVMVNSGDPVGKDDKKEVVPPFPYDKFLEKRFKASSQKELVDQLLRDSDYLEYYPEFLARNLRKDRVIALLTKFYRGVSLKPIVGTGPTPPEEKN